MQLRYTLIYDKKTSMLNVVTFYIDLQESYSVWFRMSVKDKRSCVFSLG